MVEPGRRRAARAILAPREALVAACRALNALGINQGTSGNVSLRDPGDPSGATMLISPSAIPYETMQPAQVAAMPLDHDDGRDDGIWRGPHKPSTEWRFHRDIMRARPEVGAVVHAHPTYATALAMAHRPIPAAHYMVAAFGGAEVRCAPYATFGSAALSAHALAALEGRTACLLANHGVIVCAADLDRALWLAVELETLARQYCVSLTIGGPVLLGEHEVAEVRARFADYGRQTPKGGRP